MKIKNALKILLASIIYASAMSTPLLAQSADPTPTPTPTPSPSESPTPQTSPSPTPDASPSPTPDPTPSSSPAAGGTTQGEVLGDTTELGSTSSQKEIAKWAISSLITIAAFLLVLKTLRSAQE